MIKVVSSHLKPSDLALLRKYCIHVLNQFVRPSTLRKAVITVKVIKADELSDAAEYHDFREAKAWVDYKGIEDGRKKFDVIMNASRYNTRAKLPWIRLKHIMLDVGHEMVHVKQYLNNELFDYADGKARYKGEIFHNGQSEDLKEYFNSPWEIEAYGREYGLYKVFVRQLKHDLKEKNKK
jgi:hypothetical protein